jgi:hypothetical protein
LSAPTPSLTQSCSSAKAVHDMRCPNYTGFKPRLGGGPEAAPAPELDPAAWAAPWGARCSAAWLRGTARAFTASAPPAASPTTCTG